MKYAMFDYFRFEIIFTFCTIFILWISTAFKYKTNYLLYIHRVEIRIKNTVKLLFNEKGHFISLWYRQLNNINIFMAQACGFCTGNAKVV